MIVDVDSPLASITPQGVDRRLLRNDVYELLLERILRGDLKPGTRLKDTELTAWLLVSRTPVREALSRLSAIGLVATAPNRYTLVARLDSTEIASIAHILRLLYQGALADALDTMSVEVELELDLLAGRLERDPQTNPVDVLRRVLTLMLSMLPNRVLADTIEALQLRVFRYLYLADSAAGQVAGAQRVAGLARTIAVDGARAGGEILEMLHEIGASAEESATASDHTPRR
ncbi:GntR family transcriptional regulator [Leifsonia sp. NPDC058292]|uniref:GntR family transcriptional regulator n=1 Tax=Leifsonia sp. NPDC058292 TaxID=3346428 RepID=UPI0036DC3898